MKEKKTSIEVKGNSGPTVRGVESLIRELAHLSPAYDAYEKCCKEYRDRMDEFENSPEMVKLGKKREALHAVYLKTRGDWKRDVERVRRKYLAEGLSDAVVKAVKELANRAEHIQGPSY